MKNNTFLHSSVTLSILFALIMAVPAAASTKDEIKALKGEIEVLQQGQAKMQKDLDEIKNLLKQGARAAPGAAAFKPKDLVVGQSTIIGDTNAPLTMFSYSDYQCPFCRRHATTVMTEIVDQYVDSGKLRIVMREFPIERIHSRAFAAAQAAMCAGEQGHYEAMHDLIFTDQKALADENLMAHAMTLGLDKALFEACIANQDIAEAVRADIKEAQSMGITGTPSFVVGLTDQADSNKVRVTQYIRGAQAFPRFQAVIVDFLDELNEAE